MAKHITDRLRLTPFATYTALRRDNRAQRGIQRKDLIQGSLPGDQSRIDQLAAPFRKLLGADAQQLRTLRVRVVTQTLSVTDRDEKQVQSLRFQPDPADMPLTDQAVIDPAEALRHTP